MKNKEKSNGYLAKVTITITVGLIALVLAALFVAFFFIFSNQREMLKFIAAVVAAAAAITSAFYIGQNLRQGIKSEKIGRTIAYSARWNDPAFFHPRRTFRRIMNELVQRMEQNSTKDRLALINELISEEPNNEQNVTCVLNFLEELAIMVNKDIVEEEIIDEFYHTIVVRCYSSLEPWIKELRSKRGPRLYADLTKLYERWAKT